MECFNWLNQPSSPTGVCKVAKNSRETPRSLLTAGRFCAETKEEALTSLSAEARDVAGLTTP